jgi:hypothetical protein
MSVATIILILVQVPGERLFPVSIIAVYYERIVSVNCKANGKAKPEYTYRYQVL